MLVTNVCRYHECVHMNVNQLFLGDLPLNRPGKTSETELVVVATSHTIQLAVALAAKTTHASEHSCSWI